MSGWNKNLASIWTNNVAPSRPSNAEMCVYTKYLRELQSQCGQRIKMLVLGSTPEFRDWGFEQAIDISVVDKSIINAYLEKLGIKTLKNQYMYRTGKK